jgi:enoyl-CoA hydratase/carnithine racemase
LKLSATAGGASGIHGFGSSGQSRCAEFRLDFSARMVDTAEAERLGLVRQLPADNFRAHVQAIARELVTASSPRSIGVIKRQVFQSYFQSLAEAWAVADKEMIASFGSEDFKEGVAHFVEKRTLLRGWSC